MKQESTRIPLVAISFITYFCRPRFHCTPGSATVSDKGILLLHDILRYHSVTTLVTAAVSSKILDPVFRFHLCSTCEPMGAVLLFMCTLWVQWGIILKIPLDILPKYQFYKTMNINDKYNTSGGCV